MVPKRTLLPLLVLLAGYVQAASAAPPPPVTQWIPDDAVIVLEVAKPRALLDVALTPKTTAMVEALPAYQKAAAQPDFRELVKAVDYLERGLRVDWQTGLKKFFGGGLTISVHPHDAVLMAVDCEDEAMLKQLQEIVRGFAQMQGAQQGDAERVKSREYRGVTGWSFGPGESHCLIGNRLVVANKPELLKRVIDLKEDGKGPCLAAVPEYQAARKAAGENAVAAAFVNLKFLKQVPKVQQSLKENTEPLPALLFAGLIDALKDSNWLSMGLSVDGPRLSLRTTVDGKSTSGGLAAFGEPKSASEGSLPNLDVPRRIAAMSFYRDLHGFYAAKDKLFPERTSGLIFFENMMGIFFTGRDLTEEVLGELGPEFRAVVAGQQYDPAVGTPAIQVPAFAFVFRLRDPDKFAEVVEEAWQKALGLINFTRGQQALPGLIIDRATHNDTKYTVAYFSAKQEKDRKALDARFNFRPALARAGEFMVLSSTEQLTCDVIDSIKKQADTKTKPLAGSQSVIETDGSQLAAVLAANRDNLVRQNMVSDGNSKEQAETQIDILIALAKALGSTRIEMGTRQGLTEASMEMKLNLP